MWQGADWIHVTEYGPVAGSCEQDDEPSSYLKDG